MTMGAPADAPYFTFESDVKPVPATPTHCRGCGAELEPLRRTGGLCRACIAKRTRPVLAADAQLGTQLTVVRQFHRQRPGHRERFVEVKCTCGQLRVLKWSTWVHNQPRCCNRCRMRGIDVRGFEAEMAR